MENNYKIYFTYIKLIGIVMVPIILICLPADYFDNGKSICISVLLLDEKCFGCGLTRGIMHLIHFEFEKTSQFNNLSFVVLPIIIISWTKEGFKLLNKLKCNRIGKF